MARIRINDLPSSMKISRADMREVFGRGVTPPPIIIGTGGDPLATGVGETMSKQEMNILSDIQYLQLQQKMQSENRQYTTISNVMKVKHDTAKAAINNVR